MLDDDKAYLVMTVDDMLTIGLMMISRPLGKKNTKIHSLYGGEKALTALS